jgi:hypothetical protein
MFGMYWYIHFIGMNHAVGGWVPTPPDGMWFHLTLGLMTMRIQTTRQAEHQPIYCSYCVLPPVTLLQHLNSTTYGQLLGKVIPQLVSALRSDARIVWANITPVPTDPPANCTLIPGRLESNVKLYNSVADAVLAQQNRITTCDLHSVINNYCGAGYSSCNITQVRASRKCAV